MVSSVPNLRMDSVGGTSFHGGPEVARRLGEDFAEPLPAAEPRSWPGDGPCSRSVSRYGLGRSRERGAIAARFPESPAASESGCAAAAAEIVELTDEILPFASDRVHGGG